MRRIGDRDLPLRRPTWCRQLIRLSARRSCENDSRINGRMQRGRKGYGLAGHILGPNVSSKSSELEVRGWVRLGQEGAVQCERWWLGIVWYCVRRVPSKVVGLPVSRDSGLPLKLCLALKGLLTFFY